MADQIEVPVFIPEVDESVIGYAGHVVAAILQTAGIYGQSEILTVFTPYLGLIAKLIYLWCLVGGVASVAIFGDYKCAAYFLLGPALFLWVLQTTVPAKGTVWHFGDRVMEDNPDKLFSLMKWKAFETDRAKEKTPHVSYFYAVFDNTISSIVQGLVAVLLDTKNKQDLIYVARERMLTQLYRIQGTEEGFIALLAKGLMGHCGELAVLSHQLTLNYNTESSLKIKEFRQSQYTERFAVPLTLDLDIKRYIHEVLTYHSTKTDRPISAEDKAYLILSDQYLRNDDPLLVGPVEQDIDVRCEDIWRYTTLASWMVAEQYLTSDYDKKQHPDIDWNKVKEYVSRAIVYDSEKKTLPSSKATEVVAAFLIRNTLSNNIYGNVTENLQSHAGWDPAMYRTIFGTVAAAEREVGRSKLEYFAGTIPYIQGVLLFLLSLAFPFFSVFLLMPGNVAKFAVWMGLWVWVKSWDVGFALIYFLRDLFWQYMQNDIRTKSKIENMDWNSPHLIYTVMLENDPLTNLNTYYHIIALFTLAIPFLSAHLCLGATEAYDALKNSIDQQAIKFGGRKGRAVRRMHASMIGRMITKYRADYVLSMADWAQKNPGKNLLGELRSSKGDGTHANFMDITKRLAEAKVVFDPQQQMHKNMLAAVTGRKMAYDTGVAQGVAEAYVGLMNEKYQGRDMLSNSLGWPGMFDSRSNAEDGGIGFAGVGIGEEGYDNYGGNYGAGTDD